MKQLGTPKIKKIDFLWINLKKNAIRKNKDEKIENINTL